MTINLVKLLLYVNCLFWSCPEYTIKDLGIFQSNEILLWMLAFFLVAESVLDAYCNVSSEDVLYNLVFLLVSLYPLVLSLPSSGEHSLSALIKANIVLFITGVGMPIKAIKDANNAVRITRGNPPVFVGVYGLDTKGLIAILVLPVVVFIMTAEVRVSEALSLRNQTA